MNLQAAHPGQLVSVLVPGIDAQTGQQAWRPGVIEYADRERATLCIKMLTGPVKYYKIAEKRIKEVLTAYENPTKSKEIG